MGLMDKMMNVMMDSMNAEEKQNTMLKMMPAMMKEIKGSDIMDILRDKLSEMMFVTHKSKLNFSETIQQIKKNGEAFGWYNPVITNRLEIEENFGFEDANKVAAVSMCIPRAGHNILKINKKLAVMMPMQITVYEDDDQVYVVWMNIKMMGKMFGKEIADIMGKAAEDLMTVHRDIIETEGGAQ